MPAIHVNSTAPFRADEPYALSPLEALTSVAAALSWRHTGGEIVLHTDPRGLRFYEDSGLCDAYSEIDVSILDGRRKDLGPYLAAAPCLGRMLVLGAMERPFVALDLDFVLFDDGRFPYSATDLCCFHWELPASPWYPEASELFVPAGFALPDGLDYLSLVPNIAFLYVGDIAFFRAYAAMAADYVMRAVDQQTGVAANKIAIFADQRLLGMLAQRSALTFDTLRNDIWTCGPVGERWEVLDYEGGIRPASDFRDLVAPFWVLDRHRFDPRKEAVDCVHLWFEKPRFSEGGRHASRRTRLIERLVDRVKKDFGSLPVAGKLFDILESSGFGISAPRQSVRGSTRGPAA
ncbi:hypothetical protein [Microvirga calopogonii]|uniref:hypothetical protein n=1 Tax=Microvirga calopogonii TaxID=2078013 RepID=UPI000E0D5165|nr:hypothetical protein [Microvirga calopogonii]